MRDVFLPKPIIFEWDQANQNKSWLKHNVSIKESEQVFFDKDRRLWSDVPHSKTEPRYIILGKTENNRLLFEAFTIRAHLVRIISARDADKRERKIYGQNLKKKQQADSARI